MASGEQQSSSKLEDVGQTEGESGGEVVGMKCRAPLKEVSVKRLNSQAVTVYEVPFISLGELSTTTTLWCCVWNIRLVLNNKMVRPR